MPNVPVIQQRSVMPDLVNRDTRPFIQQPNFDAANGLAGVAKDFGTIAGAAGQGLVDEQNQRLAAQKEMRGVMVADAMVQLDRANAKRTSSLKQLRGKNAFDASGETLDGLDDDRKKIAEGITDPHARAEFLQRGASTVVAYSHSTENYADEQFKVAQVQTAKALEESSLASLESGVLDFDAWREQSKRVEQSINDLASSPEAAAAQLGDYRSKSAVALTSGMLAQGKVDEAQKYIEENKGTLGSRYQETKRAVDRAEAGAQKDFLVQQAGKLVTGNADALRNEDGYLLDDDALRNATDLDEVDPSIREQVSQALDKQIRVEAAKLKADVNKERDNAYRADNVGRAIPGATWDFLQKYDPDFISAWNARKRAEALAWRRERDGSAADKAAARREQAEADQEFKDRYATEVLGNPNLSEQDFKVQFIAEKAKQGRDITVTDAATAKAGLIGATVRKRVEKGDIADDRRNASRIETTIMRSFPKGVKPDQSVVNARVGAAITMLQQREASKGSPLDDKEMAVFEADITRQIAVETPGRFWGTNTKKMSPLDVPAPTSDTPPAARPIIKENATGKRRYLNADGTLGEEVPP